MLKMSLGIVKNIIQQANMRKQWREALECLVKGNKDHKLRLQFLLDKQDRGMIKLRKEREQLERFANNQLEGVVAGAKEDVAAEVDCHRLTKG